jgi:hypothetical protein
MKILSGVACVSLILVPAPVLALGEETFGNAPLVKQPDWVDGVIDVVNLKSRVYSQWVNGNENFFYRGDARALNEALRMFTAVKDQGRQLILLPGPGKTHSFERKPIAFDWQFHVPSGIYKAVSKRSHVVMTVYVNARKPKENVDRKAVENWLSDLNSDSFEAREKASLALEKLGKGAKPFLRAALKGEPAPEARRRIETLLGKLNEVDVTDLEIPEGTRILSVDDLLEIHGKALKEDDPTMRGLAIQDLSALAPYSEKVGSVLIEMLGKDQNEWVRRVAAGCVAHGDFKVKSAIPALKAGLNDPDANIRQAFQAALDEIANGKEPAGRDEELKRRQLILGEINNFKKKGWKN